MIVGSQNSTASLDSGGFKGFFMIPPSTTEKNIEFSMRLLMISCVLDFGGSNFFLKKKLDRHSKSGEIFKNEKSHYNAPICGREMSAEVDNFCILIAFSMRIFLLSCFLGISVDQISS